MKPLFITIDTEGDSLWTLSDEVTTKNVKSIPIFQELCEKYGFIPIWLTDYEIISDSEFVKYIKPKAQEGLCEVGIHVHAFFNPPFYELNRVTKEGELLIEYPEEIMYEKIKYLKDIIEKEIECPVITHRAGRWALDGRYIGCLNALGIKYDCSVTPGMNWHNFGGATEKSHGTDYTKFDRTRCIIRNGNNIGIIEYPVSIWEHNHFFMPSGFSIKGLAKEAFHRMKRDKIWLRPTGKNLRQMKYIIRRIMDDPGEEFAEFMIHSSELHLGTNHLYRSEKERQQFYKDIEELFIYAKEIGFYGATFNSFEEQIRVKNENYYYL